MLKRYCELIGILPTTLLGKSRLQEICAARWILWDKMSKAGYSYSECGRILGKDHATVMHGINQLRTAKEKQWAYVLKLLELTKEFKVINKNMSEKKEILVISQPKYGQVAESYSYAARPCIHCHGEGGFTDETGRDEHTFKICPVCKGKGLVQPVVTVVWNPPENAPLTRLAQESVS